MTPKLRRSHQIIWLMLAVALPVGFGTALLQREQPLTQEPVGQRLPAPLPNQLRLVDDPAMTLTLRQATDSTTQLEFRVKKALDVPSAVVRVQHQGGWQAVGLLNAPGLYRFALPGFSIHPHIEIIDSFHSHTLYTFQL